MCIHQLEINCAPLSQTWPKNSLNILKMMPVLCVQQVGNIMTNTSHVRAAVSFFSTATELQHLNSEKCLTREKEETVMKAKMVKVHIVTLWRFFLCLTSKG